MGLARSGDRKVAAEVRGKKPVVNNSFGLPSGREYSCPGATSVCERVCYAGRLERLRPNVKSLLMRNWDLVKDATFEETFALLDEMVTEFEAECERKSQPKAFRIHWDGDFFTERYTRAWQAVIMAHPDTRFWVYTRVPRAARMLQGLDNLALYFSGDADNINIARELESEGIRIAMLEQTFDKAREVIGRGAMCPEQRNQIQLNGACIACGICPKGKVNVLFSIGKR